jgi:hypothetical protein
MGTKVAQVVAQRRAEEAAAMSGKKPPTKRTQTPQLEAVQQRAAALVNAELDSPFHTQLLADEEKHENHKMEVATKKELDKAGLDKTTVPKQKRARKTKVTLTEDKKIEEPKVPAEPEVKITTLLLMVTTSGPSEKNKKAPRKKRHALMLWEDGPSMHPVSSLPRWVVEEYTAANLRGFDGACSSCTSPEEHDTPQHFEDHKIWHSSFREFVRIRSGVIGGFPLHNPEPEKVKTMLDVLTKLWQKVAPSSPWFLSDASQLISQRDNLPATPATVSSSVPVPVAPVDIPSPVSALTFVDPDSSGRRNALGLRRVRVGNYA